MVYIHVMFAYLTSDAQRNVFQYFTQTAWIQGTRCDHQSSWVLSVLTFVIFEEPFRENSFNFRSCAVRLLFQGLLFLACQCCKARIFISIDTTFKRRKKRFSTQCLARINPRYIVPVVDVAFVARNRRVLVLHRQKNTKIYSPLASRSSMDPERGLFVMLAFCWSRDGKNSPKKISVLGVM